MKIRTKILKSQVFYTEEDKKEIENFIKKNEGKTVSVTLELDTRSNQQNSLYWSFLTFCVEQGLGCQTSTELHDIFKQMFLEPKFVTIKDQEYYVFPTTTNLSTAKFAKYFEQCLLFAGENIDTTYFTQSLKNLQRK